MNRYLSVVGKYWLAAVAVFLVMPLLVVLIDSLNQSVLGDFPPHSLSLVWYQAAIMNTTFQDGFVNSIVVAIGSTAIAVAAGVSASIVIAREDFPGKQVVRAALTAPLGIPRIALGLSCFVLFLLAALWVPATGDVLETRLSLIFAHALFTMPVVVIIVGAGLVHVEPELESAAFMLGANYWQTLWRVILPVISPTVVAATLFAFVFSFDDVEAALFLVPFAGATLPVAMYDYLDTHTDPTLAVVSTVLISISIAGLALASRFISPQEILS